jgi:hypothetical protein
MAGEMIQRYMPRAGNPLAGRAQDTMTYRRMPLALFSFDAIFMIPASADGSPTNFEEPSIAF